MEYDFKYKLQNTFVLLNINMKYELNNTKLIEEIKINCNKINNLNKIIVIIYTLSLTILIILHNFNMVCKILFIKNIIKNNLCSKYKF